MNDDIQRINEQLSKYPEEIYKATTRTEELREIWQLIEARKEYEESKAYLIAKASNLTEGQAKAKANGAIYETTMSTVAAESAYRRALADQIRIENEFTSVRKRANLLETTLQHMGRAA